MKILLADDHAVVRQGYQSLLEAMMPEVEIIGAGSGTDAALLFIQHAPDVVVLDINMPDMSGIEVCRQIRKREPDARVLMFSMYEEPGMIREALDAGALGYLSKSSAPDLMMTAVQAVFAGEPFLDPAIEHIVGRRSARRGPGMAPDSNASLQELPPREREIAERLLEGKGNQVIADELGISAKTVANRATVIRQKLGVSSTAELIRRLLGQG